VVEFACLCGAASSIDFCPVLSKIRRCLRDVIKAISAKAACIQQLVTSEVTIIIVAFPASARSPNGNSRIVLHAWQRLCACPSNDSDTVSACFEESTQNWAFLSRSRKNVPSYTAEFISKVLVPGNSVHLLAQKKKNK
jgi:hypothetical protein